MPGNGQLHIFDSTEATIRRSESKSNQGCKGDVMQRLDKILMQADPVAVSCK
jgi:hypothetical protein